MKIALISLFNEESSIERAIESIYKYVDEIHCFDGAYSHYPHTDFRSTDDTKKKALKCGKKVVWHDCDRAYKDQIEKRTRMFRVGKEGDTFFILDADEYVLNPEKIDWNCDVGFAWTRSNLYDSAYTTPRVIKWRPKLHYAGRHSFIYDGQRVFVASHQHTNPKLVNKVLDVSVYNLRKQARDKDKRKFRAIRNLSESKYKTENIYRKGEKLRPLLGRASRTGRGFETIFNNGTEPKYSLIVPFSRSWAVNKWFNHFAKVELPPETEILVIVDTADRRFYNQVQTRVLQLQKFVRVKTLQTHQKPVGETTRGRRARILSHMYKFQCEVRGEIVLGAEDDTLPDLDAYTKLLKTLKAKKAGFVQGTELGRWGAYQCVPHWKITDKQVETAEYKGQDLVEIDGGGWYCFVMPADVFRTPTVRKSDDPPMGPDVCFVNDIKKAGHACYGDWSVNCEHFTETKSFHPLKTPAMKFGKRLVSNSPQRIWREIKWKKCKTKYTG